MYNVFIEVCWDNVINGDDIILIGTAYSDKLSYVEQTLTDYFGKQIEILGNSYVKTTRGTCYYWLEEVC